MIARLPSEFYSGVFVGSIRLRVVGCHDSYCRSSRKCMVSHEMADGLGFILNIKPCFLKLLAQAKCRTQCTGE